MGGTLAQRAMASGHGGTREALLREEVDSLLDESDDPEAVEPFLGSERAWRARIPSRVTNDRAGYRDRGLPGEPPCSDKGGPRAGDPGLSGQGVGEIPGPQGRPDDRLVLLALTPRKPMSARMCLVLGARHGLVIFARDRPTPERSPTPRRRGPPRPPHGQWTAPEAGASQKRRARFSVERVGPVARKA